MYIYIYIYITIVFMMCWLLGVLPDARNSFTDTNNVNIGMVLQWIESQYILWS